MQSVIEAAIAVIIAVNEEIKTQAMATCLHNAAEARRPQTGGSSSRQLVFDRNAIDQYTALNNFEMEVTNIFFRRHYELSDVEM